MRRRLVLERAGEFAERLALAQNLDATSASDRARRERSPRDGAPLGARSRALADRCYCLLLVLLVAAAAAVVVVVWREEWRASRRR